MRRPPFKLRQHNETLANFLCAGLVREDYIQASGPPANNKIEADNFWKDELLRTVVLEALSLHIKNHRINHLIPVPSGANKWTQTLSRKNGIGWTETAKTDDKEFVVVGELPAFSEHDRIGIVEDVPNQLTSIDKLLAVVGLDGEGEKRVQALGIFDRGPVERPAPPYPLLSVIRFPIEPMLPANHELWPYAAKAWAA